MPNPSKTIAFDVDQDSLRSLHQAFPNSVIEVVNGATAASLTPDWKPGTVDLVVVKAGTEVEETLSLCRFLVLSGILGRDAPVASNSQEEMPITLGRSHTPLLVLLLPGWKSLVKDLLRAGAHSCLMLPIHAEEVASMLLHAQAGNQPGRHTLDLERAQTVDRWRDDGGQG